MSMRSAVLTATLLAAATASSRADGIDGTSNTILLFAEGTPDAALLKAPGLPWMRYDIVARPQNPLPLIGLSQSAAGLAVHSGEGGSAPVTTSLFFTGMAGLKKSPFSLRDQDSGLPTLASAVRAVAVDPSDPSGNALLLSAGHVALPSNNRVRGFNLIRAASGEAVLVDYDFTGGVPRRTPLGYTAPASSGGASLVASADGHAWATFPSSFGVSLFELGDLAGPGPLQPTHLATLPVNAASFQPESTQLGIIAILIGLLAEPRPSISIQEGDQLSLYAYDGASFRPLGQQELPSGATGLMEEEGIFYYYAHQGFLWRGIVGGGPDTIVNLGH